MLAALGFQALATTSAGMAWALGHGDNDVSRDEVLAHLTAITAAVDVPINADFEGGFAVDPDGVAANVRLAAATGIAGLSIEDSTGDPSAPLFDRGLAVERVRAAREALDASGSGVLLTARSEGFFVGRPDLDETVHRPFITVAGAAALGVRRISVGGALARVAWAGLLTAAGEIAGQGTFDALAHGAPSSLLNERFRR
jgi:methylisocitrate lyase